MKAFLVEGIVSDTRVANFDKYIKYSNDLKKLVGGKNLKQWINGSFVTRKINPKDIDLVTFVDYSTIKRLGNKLDNFRTEDSWLIYGVDAYIFEVYPKDSSLYKFTHSDISYWHAQFNRTRVNRKGIKFPKGFLEIIY